MSGSFSMELRRGLRDSQRRKQLKQQKCYKCSLYRQSLRGEVSDICQNLLILLEFLVDSEHKSHHYMFNSDFKCGLHGFIMARLKSDPYSFRRTSWDF